MGSFNAFKRSKQGGRPPGKIDALLSDALRKVEWGEYKLGDLFEIENTLSFNTDKIIDGAEYDYVTRTSLNQGILCTTGFVNSENINPAGTWSLGLLQMDFFYREKPWYAGQFVRKIIPKIEINKASRLFFSTILNKQKQRLLSVLVRDVDKIFRDTKIKLPTKCGQIDFEFMENFVAELESRRVAELNNYLLVTGLKDYVLTAEEEKALSIYKSGNIDFKGYEFEDIFDKIKQGRRLKKDDQLAGKIPFVMAGVTNTGVANYISNPIAKFPGNSITIDIFGNTFYRNYAFGAGDDTGVYWSEAINYEKECMLYFATTMAKAIKGKFSYGKKLRSSQSLKFKMLLPVRKGKIDFEFMKNYISAIQKLVIKDVVLYADSKIEATKSIVSKNWL